jgi:hypothetical protein
MGKLRTITGGAVVAAVAISTALIGAAPSMAAAPSVLDAQATLSAVAPEAAGQPTSSTSIAVTTPSSPAKARMAVAESPQVTVTTQPDADSTPESLTFHVDGARSVASSGVGTTTFATSSDAVARYVTENAVGARVLTAYQQPQASYVSRTTFDLPAGTVPEERPNGDWYLMLNGTPVGVILAPWAKDASGQSLATAYRWSGNTLEQTVHVPADATFPVVADPAWEYTYTAVLKVGSVADLHKRLHSCFNCIFPVEGAPKAFPKEGQKLPLVVRPTIGFPIAANFNCIFQYEQWLAAGATPLYPAGDEGWVFNADKGHIDGVGSVISFDFVGTPSDVSREPGETMRFYVYGSVVNSNPGGLPRAVYSTGAKATWGSMLSTYASFHGASAAGVGWHWVS